MKKTKIFLGVVFCLFLIASISFQPVIATKTMEKILDKEDCECHIKITKRAWPFPVICTILTIMFRILTRIGSIYIKITGDQPPDTFIDFLNVVINGLDTFNCNFKNKLTIYSFLN